MAMLAKKIRDKRVSRLIRRYLQSGIMVDGIVSARIEGTPQGSPLSPMLSNIMLDVMDKELEKRGHAFCRYADDCNIYVRSIERTIRDLTPKIRGWYQYFRLSEVKSVFEELDGWTRRKLRCLLWRQWKHPYTRERKLIGRGLDRHTAWKSAYNGHGAWWNAGAKHMNFVFPKKYFDSLTLASMLDMSLRSA
jgi:hypothetical protein